TRLQNAFANNLTNGAYKPADPSAVQTYKFLGRTPEQAIATNPTVGVAAVAEMSARMRETMDKSRRHHALSERSHALDIVGMIALLGATVAGLVYYARRQREEMAT
ncbi:MAG: hypothetical protein QGH25_17670, partial [Candidatus Latescibacteria bacterium]|nr:hypothetical protein [Candidatus Latescibacterota bacterium]